MMLAMTMQMLRTALTNTQLTTEIEKLNTVKQFLQDEDRWTTKTMARTIDLIPCAIDDRAAYCFCLAGAIHRFHVNIYSFAHLLEDYPEFRSYAALARYNDKSTHTRILLMLNHVIEILTSKLEGDQ